MPYGPVKVFYGTIASGASTCTSIDLGKSWSRIFCRVSSFSTNAEVSVFGSDNGNTFVTLYERVKTASMQYQQILIPSSVLNGIVPIDCPLQYVQFRASAVVSGGGSFVMICSD